MAGNNKLPLFYIADASEDVYIFFVQFSSKGISVKIKDAVVGSTRSSQNLIET